MADDQGDGVTDHDDEGSRKRSARDVKNDSKDTVLVAKKPELALANNSNFSLTPSGGKAASSDKASSKTTAAVEDTGSRPAKKDLQDKKKPDDRKKDEANKADTKKTDPKAKAGSSGKNKLPERYWVQVATGSYKPDLGKEWSKLKAKYPALLGHRSAWTVPLNHTNRVVIGPFRTSDEAQAFVNKAAGGGFLTSRYTSSAGQAVDPLP